MQLKRNIIDMVFADEDTVMKISKATGRKFRTVQQWLRDNDELLTIASSLNVIKEFTGLTDSEILESETTATA